MMNGVKKVKRHLDYPSCSIYDLLRKKARNYKDCCALDYYGKRISYRELISKINRCACALIESGVKSGDVISVCLPNIPQAVYLFYAINKIGATANMIHPMSAENEIIHYMSLTDSRIIFTVDLISEKIKSVSEKLHLKQVITVSPADEMTVGLKALYLLKNSGKTSKKMSFTDWNTFISSASPKNKSQNHHGNCNECAAILYSGGTTGKPKGIMLSNLNFNALALQSIDACGCLQKGDRVLSVMPVFHGFGLGVCIHTVLMFGGTAIILPRFGVNNFHKLILKYKPNVIAGVPAIYEAILRNKNLEGKKLSFIKCVISGGDSLSPSTKKKLNKMLYEHGCKCTVREGYGLTECVTGSCLTPNGCTNTETVGLPYADTYYKIINSETEDEVDIGQTGEIILRGPTVMKGYFNEPEETAEALRKRSDGKVWLYTGDLGYIDSDGYIYFQQRIKRMIVSNGYNIYPQNLENVINSHSLVTMCAVVGVPDEIKGEVVKAFIVSMENSDNALLREEIMALLRENIAAYALPKEIVFLKELPKTLVGKIAYNDLIIEGIKNER